MKFFCRKKSSLNSQNPSANDTDYVNLFKSMTNGEQLYDTLKKQCHPDLFVGSDKALLAEELFKLLQEHKMNYEKLIEIQKRIESELL